MLNKTKLVVLAAAIMLGGLTVANGQVAPQSQIKTDVPFSFVVNGKTYPAGSYSFGRLNTSSDASQIVMRGGKGEPVILDTLPTISAEAPSETHLVFEKVAGQYFLSQIWGKGDIEGSSLLNTKSEKRALEAAASGADTSSSGVDAN